MKKHESFPGWDSWKEKNKEGLECFVSIIRKGKKIFTHTDNLGIDIENTTVLLEEPGQVYAALTGDQVALTDIRVR